MSDTWGKCTDLGINRIKKIKRNQSKIVFLNSFCLPTSLLRVDLMAIAILMLGNKNIIFII